MLDGVNFYHCNSYHQVVGNSLKSLEVSEEKANQRVEEFKRQLKTLTVKHKEAEARAEFAEKTVKKLQKEVDRLEGTPRSPRQPTPGWRLAAFVTLLRDTNALGLFFEALKYGLGT